jgi:hypothetical protein
VRYERAVGVFYGENKDIFKYNGEGGLCTVDIIHG